MKHEYYPKVNKVKIPASGKTFKGYKRKNGYVGCVNGQANAIVKVFKQEHHTAQIENIHVFGHMDVHSLAMITTTQEPFLAI